ncbi:PPE family protein [Mycobacterium talmoniae]|uniref:PPE domain-containing protein n=1 Tax=Mycobacterium talmoniae TaxID=1858794 RepID=A0A1S1NHH8_9MYCO|nr:PPE family protein [Mycobacterium talmoniae]OHV03531.1 hypothetical protein BKN37_14510 [Mycobacterium talmoniae]
MPGDYGALPPEVNTARLQAGPGAEPMTQAAAAWTAKSAAYTAQASQYVALLSRIGGVWQSAAGMKMMASAAQMTAWLGVAAGLAGKAAGQASLQAAAHTAAYVATPQLVDIARNHITHDVLEATNFLGINAAPIAVNEFDYGVRMWGQAVTTMLGYETETMSNLTGLPSFTPPPMMTMPGVGVDTLGSSGFLVGSGAPAALDRDAVLTAVGTTTMMSNGVHAGAGLGATVAEVERKAEAMGMATGMASQEAAGPAEETATDVTTDATAESGQGVQFGSQAMGQLTQLTQLPSQAAQLPSQLMQAPSGLMQGPQQLMSPLQQLLSPLQQLSNGGGFGLDSAGSPVSQIGMLGASPFSAHPLAGGSGAAVGAGMMSGASVPGTGGAAARTPLLASLTTASLPNGAATSSEVAPSAGANRIGAAPVMPMGAMAGQRGESAHSTVEGLVAPGPLSFDDDVDDLDDWAS